MVNIYASLSKYYLFYFFKKKKTKKMQEKIWDNKIMDLLLPPPAPQSVIQALFLWEISRWRALQSFIYVYILLDINHLHKYKYT